MKTVLSFARTFGKVVEIGKTLLEESGYKLIFPQVSEILNEEKIIELINDNNVEAIIVGTQQITKKIINNCSNLKIIAKHGIGIDNIDIDAATKKGIVVTFAPGANTNAVAELAFGLIMAISRNIYNACLSLKLEKWETFLGQEIDGKTIGILGTGRIGKEVIRKLSGFSTKIIVFDINKDKELIDLFKVEYVSLKKLLSNSDYISIHIPLTDKTINIIDYKEINLMKKSAFLINTSRGGIVNEESLYDSLVKWKIAGAALDVWSKEPPTEISAKLASLENVLCTPHIGAYTLEALYQMGHVCAKSIIDFFSNKEPEYIANPKVFSLIK